MRSSHPSIQRVGGEGQSVDIGTRASGPLASLAILSTDRHAPERLNRGMGDRNEANRRWADMLAEWAIPDELLQAAPASPFFFDPTVFIAAAEEALVRAEDSPSDAAARESL